MPNQVHPNSKQAMCAFARKSMAGVIQMLSEAGMSYEDIENELRLVKRNGMTAWELVNKKRAKDQPAAQPAEHDEEAEWAALAKKARVSWAKENV